MWVGGKVWVRWEERLVVWGGGAFGGFLVGLGGGGRGGVAGVGGGGEGLGKGVGISFFGGFVCGGGGRFGGKIRPPALWGKSPALSLRRARTFSARVELSPSRLLW